MTKSDDKRVPVLRFKGFTDDWEQRKLGDVLSKFDYGLNSASSDYDGKNKYLRITDIDEQTHRFNLDNLTSPKVDLKNKDNYILHPGDIVFARTGASVGKTYKYREDDGRVYFAGFLIRGRINKNFDTSFIFDTTLLPKYSNFVKITSIRSGQPGINSEEYKKYVINIPTINEQKYISKLITNLEELITLQQRKVKLLELFRKAIHNNIFPEYGKETPVIRHKKFTNKWNVVKFNTIYKKSTEKNDLTYGEDKIISVAKMYFKQEKNKSSQDYLKTYNVFKTGDIAFEGNRSKGFSHGRFVQNTIGNGIVSHVFDVFTPIKKDNLKYWKYAIHNEHVMKYVLVKSTTKATMMNNLSSKDFLKQSIAVPSSEEMNTIAKILQDLDNQINITNNKINYLQNMKKFLLQNMFI
ncbi:restriction endonuclease subunit S [Lactobacillus johnsonii]|uniref:restriction endonuclease subunit S n=1 Tax=Lactobacillus johnsonii TaxID=33959 RepID=UPI00124B7AC8|nr:restriction endonuclease subunit S [Lactobacillus johnsonii]KAB1960352.1 restriction endonuclease subunit S [Lactobacillus johnsonii]MCT3345786.1 restriction endonuclease subunit S [Lactobacillus johnsonii]